MMSKKLKEILDTNKGWLLDENVNYTKEDFMKDIKRLSDNIGESHYLGLISDETSNKCKNIILEYLHLCV